MPSARVRTVALLVVLVACARGPQAPPAPTRLAAPPDVSHTIPAPDGERAPDVAATASQIYRVGGRVTKPKLIRRVLPDERKLRNIRAIGVPVIEAIIGKDGSVLQVRMVRAVDPAFDAAVIDAIKQWRFEPATLDGKPVSVYYVLTMNIDLQ